MFLTKAYKRFYKIGRISKWFSQESPDNNGGLGYGFINELESGSTYFAHISRYIGKLNKKDKAFQLTNKLCLFNVGQDPKRGGDKPTAISYLVEDDIAEDISNYYKNREIWLQEINSNEIVNLLQSHWYYNLWKEYSNNPPKLDPDKVLFQEIKNRITNSIIPFDDKQKIFGALEKTIFKIPNDYNIDEFRNVINYECELKKVVKSGLRKYKLENSNYLDQISASQKNRFIKDYIDNICIGIDIEANEDEIFQIALYGKKIKTNHRFNTSNNNIRDSFNSIQNNNWLIGHNIASWDIPRIKRTDSTIILSTILWDTLLVSWLLQPWKEIHALTSSLKAHDALEDAKASLKLFKVQLKNFDKDLVPEFENQESSDPQRINVLANHIKEDKVNYPDPPKWLNKKDHTYIIPDFMMKDVMWIQGVIFNWPNGYSEFEDQIIEPSKLSKISEINSENIYLTLLSSVVNLTLKKNIQILVRMLPIWLRGPIEDFLPHMVSLKSNSITSQYKVITYSSLRKSLSPSEVQKQLSQANTICLPGGKYELLSEGEALTRDLVLNLRQETSNKTKIFDKLPNSGTLFVKGHFNRPLKSKKDHLNRPVLGPR